MAKPASWVWDADLVINDGHRVLAQACTWLVPLWEGTGSPKDVVTGATADSVSGGWVTNGSAEINGPAYQINASGEHVRFAANAAFQMDGDIDISWLITLQKTATFGIGDYAYMAVRTSFAAGLWEVIHTGLIIHTGSQNNVAHGGSDAAAGVRMVCGSRTASNNQYRFWVDGTLIGSPTNALTPSSASHQLWIGKEGDDTNAQHGDYALVALWKNYALTQSDVDLLAPNYGFGLITQVSDPAYEQSDYRFFNDNGIGLGEAA